MERTKAHGEDQLHLSGVVEKQDSVCVTQSYVYKREKRYRYTLQIHVYVCTHRCTYDIRACEVC